MENRAFSKLLEQLKNLTPSQKEIVSIQLHEENSLEVVQESMDKVESCPHCQSQSFHKWGTRANIQRYRCKECHKTFNALTGTPLARLRYKEQWRQFAQDLIDGVSIRESAKHCGVNKNTTLKWRHRMLNNAKKTNETLNGIVEFDETYFLESHKGERNLKKKARHRGGSATQRGISSEQIAVLVARDRSGHTMDAILFKSNKDTLAQILLPNVDKDSLLCSDSKPSYKAFAKKYDRILKTINSKAKEYVKEHIYHIQNVNAYDSRLKVWMKHFNGVSTKYLETYLGWMRLLDTHKSLTPEELLGIISKRNMLCQPLF